MDASAAPSAFHVQKEVKPAQWVVLYQGSFQTPQGGQYRLAGYADDVLVVRLNGRTVLDGSRMRTGVDKTVVGLELAKVSNQDVKPEHTVGNGSMIYSAWLRFDTDQPNKIEIMVGERPGGQFCAYLFLEERGKNYKKATNGRPILPIFRTADMETFPDPTALFEAGGPVFGSQ